MRPAALVRTAVAGVLMGVANLIPGVSGGTMVLAMGLYREFIDSVADLTALRFSARRIVFLAVLAGCAGVSIVLLAGLILYLLFHYPVAMFSLFIGLTLGGAPLLWASLRPARADVVVATLAGFLAMLAVAALKRVSGGLPHNLAIDLLAGVVGSTTMVLPGISGSYMLLVMDQYERIVGAVSDLKHAVSPFDPAALRDALWIIVPVGIGAVAGIVALSNVLKVLLRRAPRPTVGVLLGVLIGSVLMMWPFTQGVGGKALERRSLDEVRAYALRWGLSGAQDIADRDQLVAHIQAHWDQRRPPPITPASVAVAAVMIVVGFLATTLLAGRAEGPTLGRSGADDPTTTTAGPAPAD
jgi:putative membrane protein